MAQIKENKVIGMCEEVIKLNQNLLVCGNFKFSDLYENKKTIIKNIVTKSNDSSNYIK